MQFGKHIPTVTRVKGPQSPAAAFTRGLALGHGNHWKFAFENGYGASVIDDGYGSERGLYEVGVLKDGHLTYSTPITDDVIGFLTAEQVGETLDQIEALTPEVVLQGQIDREVRRIAEEIAAHEERIAALRAELANIHLPNVTAS